MQRLALLVCLAAGCGFKSAPGDMALDDGGMPDAPIGGRGDLAGGGGDGGCAPPVLLVGVERLDAGATTGGRVLRFSLASGVTACPTLSAKGALPPQPMAVAFVPPDGVAAATRDGLWVLNLDDTVRFKRAHTQLPIDVFPIAGGAETLVAVGYWHAGSAQPVIDHVDAHRDGAAPVHTWTMNSGGFPLSFGVRSMAQSPRDPAKLFALENPSGQTPAAAAEVDPYAPAKTSYVPYPAGDDLVSVATLVHAGYNRTVWVDRKANAVYYVRENNGNPAFSGPITCAGRACELVHAVPDPTNPTGFFALCEKAASVERDVVRFSSTGGTCDVTFAGAQAGTNTRLSRLGVQP